MNKRMTALYYYSSHFDELIRRWVIFCKFRINNGKGISLKETIWQIKYDLDWGWSKNYKKEFLKQLIKKWNKIKKYE